MVRVRAEHWIDVSVEPQFAVGARAINVVVAPIRAVAVFKFQAEQRRDSNGDGVNVGFGATVEVSRFLRHVSLGSHNGRFLRHRFSPKPKVIATQNSLPKRKHVAKEAVSAALQTKTRQRSERICKPNDAPKTKPRPCVKPCCAAYESPKSHQLVCVQDRDQTIGAAKQVNADIVLAFFEVGNRVVRKHVPLPFRIRFCDIIRQNGVREMGLVAEVGFGRNFEERGEIAIDERPISVLPSGEAWRAVNDLVGYWVRSSSAKRVIGLR